MVQYDKNKIFTSIITSRTRETFEVDDTLIQLGQQLEMRPQILKGLYKVLRKLEHIYEYVPSFGATFTYHFDYENQEAQIYYNQLDQLFSIIDLQDFMGIVDSVYSPIYPLGFVVELDLELLPEELQKSLAEGPGPLVTISGRKMTLQEGFDDYVVDYLARIWPLGEMPGMDAFFVSNMMIERLRFEGYSDDWESQFTEDVLRATQLSQQQVSTAFMRSEDFVRYYEPYLNTEEG